MTVTLDHLYNLLSKYNSNLSVDRKGLEYRWSTLTEIQKLDILHEIRNHVIWEDGSITYEPQ